MMTKELQKKPHIRLLVSFLFLFLFIFLGMISESHADASGVWEGTSTVSILGEQEETVPFVDALYQNGDIIYMPGTILCPGTEVSVAFNRVSGNMFSLASPVNCSYLGYDLTLNVFSLTFPNDNAFTGTFSGTAVGFPFSGSVQGGRVQVSSQLSLNVPVTGLSGSEGSYQAFYIDVPAGTSGLSITTTGGFGDSDLYLIYSQPPFYLYESYSYFTDESILVPVPNPGIWYVIMEGWESYGGVTLNYTDNISSIVPDIKANGSDDPITVSYGNPFTITGQLNAGSMSGQNADWWVGVNLSGEWYHYDLSSGWMSGITPTYQGPLFDLNPYNIPGMSGLDPGTYTFYLAVDMVMNGSLPLDMSQIYYDSVQVNITP